MTSDPMDHAQLARILREPTIELVAVPADPATAAARASGIFDQNVHRTMVSAGSTREVVAELGIARGAAQVAVALGAQFDRVQLANTAAVALVLLGRAATDKVGRRKLAEMAYLRAVANCGARATEPRGEPCPTCMARYVIAEAIDTGLMFETVAADDGLMAALADAPPAPHDPTA